MKENSILGVSIRYLQKSQVLEKIKKYLRNPSGFFQIVSLNPENLVIVHENKEFKKVLETSQIKIVDGVGVVLAGRALGIKVGERIPGVELMRDMLKEADRLRLRVLLIGGKGNLALQLVECYEQSYPQAKFMGDEGFKNIKNQAQSEKNALFSIVASYKPHIIFAAFGSPDQELWFYHHKDRLNRIICMGVGGAFDYEGEKISRAPLTLRRIGLEWLFRLVRQPWRWRRQLRLIKFCWLVLKQKFTNSVPVHPQGV